MEYKTIGDSLTEEEFNAFVCLIRQNNTITKTFTITESIVKEDYFKLTFDFTDATILDNGVLITDKTKDNPPHVKMENITFIHSNHKLNLKVCDRENYDLYNRNKTFSYETLSIPLEVDENTTFPITEMDNGLIILFDEANVLITHDKPIIKITEE